MKSRRAGSRSRSADEEGGALNTVALATLVLTGILFLLAMGLLMYVHRRLAGGLRYPRVRGVCVCNSVSRSARPRIALRCTRPCSREASSQVLCNGTTESENGDSSLNPPPPPPPPPTLGGSEHSAHTLGAGARALLVHSHRARFGRGRKQGWKRGWKHGRKLCIRINTGSRAARGRGLRVESWSRYQSKCEYKYGRFRVFSIEPRG